MGLIVATSRGNGLTSLRKEKNTKLMVFRGGKLRDMAQAAVNTLSSFPPSQSTNTVYFVSGLPDTTLKLKKKFHMNGRKRFYEEVIINSTAKNIHRNILKIIKAADKSIKNANAIPIFSTILYALCVSEPGTDIDYPATAHHTWTTSQNMTICNQFLKKLSPSSTHPSLASTVKTKSPPLKYVSPSCTSVKDISAADMANSLMEYTQPPK